MATLSHSSFDSHSGSDRTSRRAGAVVAIGLHIAAAVALLSYQPARKALLEVAPIMVDLITPPKPVEIRSAPPVEVHKPKPTAPVVRPPRPTSPPPSLITAPSQAPSPVVAAPPAPPQPPAPIAEASAPTHGPPASPVTVTPPIFSADYLENPPPAYPAVSRKMREEGRVMLRVHVTMQGTADEVQVRTTSGNSRLDDAAVETVRRWKFVPAKRGNDAVSAWVLIPVSFKLDS